MVDRVEISMVDKVNPCKNNAYGIQNSIAANLKISLLTSQLNINKFFLSLEIFPVKLKAFLG